MLIEPEAADGVEIRNGPRASVMALEGLVVAGWQMEGWFGVFWPPPLPVLCFLYLSGQGLPCRAKNRSAPVKLSRMTSDRRSPACLQRWRGGLEGERADW